MKHRPLLQRSAKSPLPLRAFRGFYDSGYYRLLYITRACKSSEFQKCTVGKRKRDTVAPNQRGPDETATTAVPSSSPGSKAARAYN